MLIRVQETDEPEIRKIFEQTLAVRELSPQARVLADRFFETLVRVHRAGEGAPFTGLKPAGRDLGPAIPAADEAVRVGSVEPVNHLLTAAIQARLRHQCGELTATKTFTPDDVAAGRAYVKAYVEFIHFVELLYDSTRKTPHGHFEERDAAPTTQLIPRGRTRRLRSPGQRLQRARADFSVPAGNIYARTVRCALARCHLT